MLKAGEESPVSGFVVVEARPGRYEVYRRIDSATTVNFTGSTEAQVLDAAASWLYEQARRKDGGALKAPPPPAKPRLKKNKYEIEA